MGGAAAGSNFFSADTLDTANDLDVKTEPIDKLDIRFFDRVVVLKFFFFHVPR